MYYTCIYESPLLFVCLDEMRLVSCIECTFGEEGTRMKQRRVWKARVKNCEAAKIVTGAIC